MPERLKKRRVKRITERGRKFCFGYLTPTTPNDNGDDDDDDDGKKQCLHTTKLRAFRKEKFFFFLLVDQVRVKSFFCAK